MGAGERGLCVRHPGTRWGGVVAGGLAQLPDLVGLRRTVVRLGAVPGAFVEQHQHHIRLLGAVHVNAVAVDDQQTGWAVGVGCKNGGAIEGGKARLCQLAAEFEDDYAGSGGLCGL